MTAETTGSSAIGPGRGGGGCPARKSAGGAAPPPATGARPRPPPPPRGRPAPAGLMPDAGLVDAIRAVLAASPFHGEGHRKVWARLRHGGIRTSERRVLRLMGAHGLLLAPSRAG